VGGGGVGFSAVFSVLQCLLICLLVFLSSIKAKCYGISVLQCLDAIALSVKESTSHQLIDLLVAGTLFLHYRVVNFLNQSSEVYPYYYGHHHFHFMLLSGLNALLNVIFL